jgi:hypothetical protein
MKTMRQLIFLGLLLCTLGLGWVAFGQTDQARILNVVSDSNGAVVPATMVVVRNERTGIERTVAANAEGRYVVTNLPPAQ